MAGILLANEFISTEVYSKMLINSYTPSEKAAVVISAVMDKIKIDPLRFSELLKILSEHFNAKEVVKHLRFTYHNLLSESTLSTIYIYTVIAESLVVS